jgi:hypothetical protein
MLADVFGELLASSLLKSAILYRRSIRREIILPNEPKKPIPPQYIFLSRPYVLQ